MRVWRICKRVHAQSAFSGEGARLFSGRWNPAGIPMIYTSLSLALAAMEVFVHLDPITAPNDLVSVLADLPLSEADAEAIDPLSLPADWRSVNHPALAKIGADWAVSCRSLVLLVPSVVIAGEWNALVNPAHNEAHKIRVESPIAFHFDQRMFKLQKILPSS